MNQRYNPCFECLDRYGREYSKECDTRCEYAYAVKLRDVNIEDLNMTIKHLETKLKEEKTRTADLIARNAKFDFDLGRAYQLISKLTGE